MRPQLLSALNTSRSRFLGKTGTSGRILGIGRVASGTGFDMKPYRISASIIALSPFWYGKRARVLWQAACGWFGVGCAFEFRKCNKLCPLFALLATVFVFLVATMRKYTVEYTVFCQRLFLYGRRRSRWSKSETGKICERRHRANSSNRMFSHPDSKRFWSI